MKRFLTLFLITALALVPVTFPARAYAVSADITLAGGGREVECDSTQRTATLATHGGSIYNKSTGSVWINLEADTVGTSDGGTSIEVKTGVSLRLPSQCGSFTFKTASGTSYLIYVGP